MRYSGYGFVRDTLDRFGYRHLGKHDKGVVLKFLVAATGISLQQTERLVRQWRETGAVRKVRRKYLARDVMTPYARFRSLPNAQVYLKPGMDFALLDAAAAAETDLHAARRVQTERRALFLRIAAGMAPARAAG